MNTLRRAFFLALTGVAFSCGASSEPTTVPPSNTSDQLEITISSVTLADDCGTGPSASVSASQSMAEDMDVSSRSAGAAMKVAAGDRACEQSTIQLRIANGEADAATVRIRTIEVIDENGQRVAELTARDPSRWVGDSYQAWDEQVAAAQTLEVSYALSAPYVARGATYTVRVTVAAGDSERTLEQRATLEAEASMPPDAVT
jgi:hypothetical protein